MNLITLNRYQLIALIILAFLTVIALSFIVLNAVAHIDVLNTITYGYPH
jgi:hypothetical protein